MNTELRNDTAELLDRTGVAETLRPGEREQILDWLDNGDATRREPMLMKLMAGIGAWFASWFVLGAVVIGLVNDSGFIAVVVGALLMAGSVPVMHRRHSGVFIDQVGLAVALAGNALVLYGIADSMDNAMFSSLLLGQLAVAAITWWFIDHPAYRFVAAALVFLFGSALAHDMESAWVMYAVIALGLVGMAKLAAPRLPQLLLPLAHASAVSLAGIFLQLEFMARASWLGGIAFSETPMLVMLVISLLALVGRLRREEQLSTPGAVVSIVLVVVLAITSTPGILFALGMLALAYACGDRVLGVLAALFLPLFLFHYYYALDTTLAKKSFLLLASGAVLLVAREAIRRLGRSS